MARSRHAASMRGGEWTLLDERTQTVQLLPTAQTTSLSAREVGASLLVTTPVDQTTAWSSLNGTLAMCEAVVDRLQQVTHHDAERAAAAQHLAVLLRTATAAAVQCHNKNPSIDSSSILAEKNSLISLVHELRDLVAKQRVALAAARSNPTAANEPADAKPRSSLIDASAQTDSVHIDSKTRCSDKDDDRHRKETTAAASAAAAAAAAAATTAALETRCATLLARAEAAEQAAEVAERTSRVEHAKSVRLETSLAAANSELASAQARTASLSRVVDRLESIVAKQQGMLQARPHYARNSRPLWSISGSAKPLQRTSAHDNRALDDEDGLQIENGEEAEDKTRHHEPYTRHGDSADYHDNWEPEEMVRPDGFSEDRCREGPNVDAARDDPDSDVHDGYYEQNPDSRQLEEDEYLENWQEPEEEWDPERSFQECEERRLVDDGSLGISFDDDEIDHGLGGEFKGEEGRVGGLALTPRRGENEAGNEPKF